MLDLSKEYKRKDNLLYQDGVAIIWFIADTFIDIEELTKPQIKYMEKYIKMWPNRIEQL